MSLLLQPSDRLFVLTGAGISAESGLATFRGKGGLWEGNRAVDLATPEAFARNPELVWRFYSMRRARHAECKPNPGHVALAQLEKKLGERMLICTQNVDSLHEAAGSTRVLHMHGKLIESRCSNPQCASERFEDRKEYPAQSQIPVCRICGAPLRPHVCWFGEVPYDMDEVLASLQQCTVFLTVAWCNPPLALQKSPAATAPAPITWGRKIPPTCILSSKFSSEQRVRVSPNCSSSNKALLRVFAHIELREGTHRGRVRFDWRTNHGNEKMADDRGGNNVLRGDSCVEPGAIARRKSQ